MTEDDRCPDCARETNVFINGRCPGCHQARLLPVPPGGLVDTGEQWSDIYLGLNTGREVDY